ncbi:MAG: hypothetical protein IPK83_01980 [Planctomycetes bacterium]|nr:hypothetical protein [Planctomycetota bacterium]
MTPFRVALVGRGAAEIRAAARFAIESLRANPDEAMAGGEGVYYWPKPLASAGELAFVFPGSGNHFVGMGRGVGLRWPGVLDAMDARVERLASQTMCRWFAPYRASWEEGWEDSAQGAVERDTRRMIFGQVAFGIMMSNLLRHIGILPRAIIGYSLGESAGLFASRAWPDSDEMLRRMMASDLFASELYGERRAIQRAWGLSAEQAATWRAVILPKPAADVRAAIHEAARQGERFARLLIVNTPSESIVGGLPSSLEAVAGILKCRMVPVANIPTVHFEAVKEVEQAYQALHLLPTESQAGLRFYSGVKGGAYEVTRESAAESITGQALLGFDYTRVIESAYADGVRLFVEIGPQGSCTRMIRRILGERPHFAMTASVKGECEADSVVKLAAALAAQGVEIDVAEVNGVEEVVETEKAVRAGRGQVVVKLGRAAPRPTWPEWASDELRLKLDAGVAAQAEALRDTGLERADAGAAMRVVANEYMGSDELIQTAGDAAVAVGRAHEAFLAFSEAASRGVGAVIEGQARLMEFGGGVVPSMGGPWDFEFVSPSSPSAQPSPFKGEELLSLRSKTLKNSKESAVRLMKTICLIARCAWSLRLANLSRFCGRSLRWWIPIQCACGCRRSL